MIRRQPALHRLPVPPPAYARRGLRRRAGVPAGLQLPPPPARAWLDLLTTTIRVERTAPPPASRLIGYAGVTLYEALVPGMPDRQSLAGQLNGLSGLPARSRRGLRRADRDERRAARPAARPPAGGLGREPLRVIDALAASQQEGSGAGHAEDLPALARARPGARRGARGLGRGRRVRRHQQLRLRLRLVSAYGSARRPPSLRRCSPAGAGYGPSPCRRWRCASRPRPSPTPTILGLPGRMP